MLTDVATRDVKDKIASNKTQNRLLAIRTYDYGRMLITLSSLKHHLHGYSALPPTHLYEGRSKMTWEKPRAKYWRRPHLLLTYGAVMALILVNSLRLDFPRAEDRFPCSSLSMVVSGSPIMICHTSDIYVPPSPTRE